MREIESIADEREHVDVAPGEPVEIERNPEGFFVIDFDWRKPQQAIAGAASPAGARP